MKKFESEQAAWEYYLNLDSHHFEEKQHNNIYTDAFEAGVEWEHKRLVEKAYEWLRENMSRYVSKDDPDKFPYGFPTRAFRVSVNFECDFKKAMEE